MLPHPDIRDVIWDRFPQGRTVILNLQADNLRYPTHYSWVSEALWWPIFEPILREHRLDTLHKLTADLLDDDEQLHEMTQVRVAVHLCSWPDSGREMGRPRLLHLVAKLCDGPPERHGESPRNAPACGSRARSTEVDPGCARE